ncbi:glycosyltransferase [Maritimibacter sp. 55A14]|uniref:glycosyltransferase n=1 Tax=Maritimibacter sp. 55A14 TaxID=2174844 RepID=UPI000D60491F|nr:glycosyltransferase [Maritimibacter sp. 55A14]PWE32216.1 glycosyltransferase [Maritimibacter sp. 55A14]
MSAAPKVLHLHFGKEGGAERFFVNLVRAFGARGVEQRFVIRPNRSWRDQIAPFGLIVENNYRYLSISSLILQWHVRRICRTWHPDAIMAWMPRAARLIPDWPEAVKFTRLGDFPRHLDHFGHCDALVGNTPDIGRHCRALGWEKPMLTISNFARPVPPSPVRRAAHDTPEDAFLIAAAGRFVHRKGMDLVIRAAARLPGAWLWLIGDGKERPALEDLARAEGIADRTRFIGWVDEPIHHIAAADALGMASRHEPLGNVVLEAWQAGVPVVSTRSEGPGWYMRDGIDGRLVEIDDLDAFAAALAGLQADRTLGARLAEGGRARLGELFSEDRVVRNYLALFAGDFTDPLERAE